MRSSSSPTGDKTKPGNRLQKWVLGVLVAILVLLGVSLFIPPQSGPDYSHSSLARNDITQLQTAAKAYETEYGRKPPHDPETLIAVLQGHSPHDLNPRQIVFWEPRRTSKTWFSTTPGSLDPKGILIDPWGHPYLFDFNEETGWLEIWSRGRDQSRTKDAAIEKGYYVIVIKGKNDRVR